MPPTPNAKINKSAFVRSLPATMGAPEVVKAAAAKGIKLTDKFVHTIRYNARKTDAKKAARSGGTPPATVKRGPGRPRKDSGQHPRASDTSSRILAEIEALVEAKVSAILKSRLGGLIG